MTPPMVPPSLATAGSGNKLATRPPSESPAKPPARRMHVQAAAGAKVPQPAAVDYKQRHMVDGLVLLAT